MGTPQDGLKRLLDPLARVGQADLALDVYSAVADNYAEFEEVDERIRSFDLDPADVEGNVLFPFVHTQGTLNYVYGLLAHSFRTRGYRPIMPVCDADLDLCMRKESEPDTIGTCRICHHRTSAFLDAFNLSPTHFETVLGADYEPPSLDRWDDLQSVTYEGVDVADYARSTTRWFLRRRILDYDDDTVWETFTRFITAGLELVDLTNAIIDEYDIDAIVGQHVPYVYGGIPLEVCRLRDVPAYTFETGYYRKGTMLFGNMDNRMGFPAFSEHETLESVVERPLTAPQRQRIDEIMSGRYDGSAVQEGYHYVRGADRSIDPQGGDTLVGLFTNLLWDASLADADVAFESPFEWVETTIERLGDADDVHLVIKPHPAEAHRPTNDKMADWIHEHVDPIPPNVTVLEPDTDVNPYQLMHDLDVGIVYNSTLGLEMAYAGVPVVVVGETHYRDLGFTYDVSSSSAYGELLDEIDAVTMDDEMHDRVRRYAYFLFVERMIDVPFFGTDAPLRHALSHDDLAPGTEPMDSIVEQILDGERSIRYVPPSLEADATVQ